MGREAAAFEAFDRSAFAVGVFRKVKREVARTQSRRNRQSRPILTRKRGVSAVFSTVENVSLSIITRNAPRFKRDGRRFPILSIRRGDGGARRGRRRRFGRVAEIGGNREDDGGGVGGVDGELYEGRVGRAFWRVGGGRVVCGG